MNTFVVLVAIAVLSVIFETEFVFKFKSRKKLTKRLIWITALAFTLLIEYLK